MKTEVVKGYFEDWDGEMVLSDIRNFKDEKEFLEKALDYANETRGYPNQLSDPSITDIVFDDEQWMNKDIAKNDGFKGEEITVYVSELKPVGEE